MRKFFQLSGQVYFGRFDRCRRRCWRPQDASNKDKKFGFYKKNYVLK